MLYNHNGTYCDNVSLDPINRSFLYGDGFFESMRLFNGNIFNRKYHVKRILDSLSVMHLSLEISVEELIAQVEELSKKNKLELGSTARLTIFRNEGGLYTPTSTNAKFLISNKSHSHNSFLLDEGISLGICQNYTKSAQPLSYLKSTSALTYVMASIEKQSQGKDELLLLNQCSRIVEATNANVLIVKDEKVMTPPLTDGGVSGTMRSLLMEHFLMEEKSLTTADLKAADEIALCNCYGIRWVTDFDGLNHYVAKKSKEMVSLLNSLI